MATWTDYETMGPWSWPPFLFNIQNRFATKNPGWHSLLPTTMICDQLSHIWNSVFQLLKLHSRFALPDVLLIWLARRQWVAGWSPLPAHWQFTVCFHRCQTFPGLLYTPTGHFFSNSQSRQRGMTLTYLWDMSGGLEPRLPLAAWNKLLLRRETYNFPANIIIIKYKVGHLIKIGIQSREMFNWNVFNVLLL